MNVVAEQATREQDRDERNIYEVDINQYLTFLRLRTANHRSITGWAGPVLCPCVYIHLSWSWITVKTHRKFDSIYTLT